LVISIQIALINLRITLVIEERLQHRREAFVLFDQVWELVEDDDRVLIGEILEERLPVLPNPLDTWKRIRGRRCQFVPAYGMLLLLAG